MTYLPLLPGVSLSNKIFDSHKRLLYTGDAVPEEVILAFKGIANYYSLHPPVPHHTSEPLHLFFYTCHAHCSRQYLPLLHVVLNTNQIFDSHKRLLYTGDAMPDEVTLAKGEHSARLLLRHDDRALLEKLKGTCLVSLSGSAVQTGLTGVGF
jgi:hypothetical protein